MQSLQTKHLKTFTDALFCRTKVRLHGRDEEEGRQFQSDSETENGTESGWTAAITEKANGSASP